LPCNRGRESRIEKTESLYRGRETAPFFLRELTIAVRTPGKRDRVSCNAAEAVFLPAVRALGDIDVEKCRICGGTAKVIACIEELANL